MTEPKFKKKKRDKTQLCDEAQLCDKAKLCDKAQLWVICLQLMKVNCNARKSVTGSCPACTMTILLIYCWPGRVNYLGEKSG